MDNLPVEAVASDRFCFETKTGRGRCGGTNAHTFLNLFGGSSPDWLPRYPPPRSGVTMYNLDNSGDDMEAGDLDSYFLLSGTMDRVHSCDITFIRNDTNPEWQLDWCRLVRKQLRPISIGSSRTLIWKTVEVLNHWTVDRCLEQDGIYRFGPTLDIVGIATDSVRSRALALLSSDPALYHEISELVSPSLIATHHPIVEALNNLPVRIVTVACELKLPIVEFNRNEWSSRAANHPMQPSGEVGRFEVDHQQSPPADR